MNDGINKEWCSLTYMTIDDVAARVVRLGRGALMAKFDLKSAYRHVPVHPDDRWLLGMEWKGQLFVDTALPFGLRSAPAIFNAVAEALAHMIRQKGVEELDHYLDDFSIVGSPNTQQCRRDLEISLATCEEAGCPVAGEKTEGPTTVITLLGIELDSIQIQLRLPQEKFKKLKKLVNSLRKRTGCKKRKLESLAGHLSHACKVVRPGRRFLQGIFGLFKTESPYPPQCFFPCRPGVVACLRVLVEWGVYDARRVFKVSWGGGMDWGVGLWCLAGRQVVSLGVVSLPGLGRRIYCGEGAVTHCGCYGSVGGGVGWCFVTVTTRLWCQRYVVAIARMVSLPGLGRRIYCGEGAVTHCGC